MLYVADSSGPLRLNASTVDVITRIRRSLFPVGITAVDGEFSASDIVNLIDPNDEVIDHGEVNYGSKELLDMIGYHTEELPDDMQKPVVHTDYLSDFASHTQEGVVLRTAAPKDTHTWVHPDRSVSTKSS